MALAALPRPLRAASPSTNYQRAPSPSSSPRVRASASPAPHHAARAPRRPSIDKENNPPLPARMEPASPKSSNGYWSDSRSVRSGSEDEGDGVSFPRRRSAKSPPIGVATLPTVPDDAELKSDGEHSVFSDSAPPPSRSAAIVYDQNGNPVIRRRRRSSIKTKPPPGVTPTKAVDWEIPRKTFHSSIGE